MLKKTCLMASIAVLSLGLTACGSVSKPSIEQKPVMAYGQVAPVDVAVPVVELMPLTMKYAAELKLTPEQNQALADYRKTAAPKRMALQKEIETLRANLRAAIFEGKPQAERDELMNQIVERDTMHMQGRNVCVDMMRDLLSPEQFKQLQGLYWAQFKA